MATTKQVQILATYYHKTNGVKNGTVTYLVRSSDGKSTYCTTLVDGKASGCSCPAKSSCYHKKQLEAKEAGRPFAAKSLPVWTVKLVESGKLAVPGKKAAPAAPKIATIIKEAVEAKVPAPKKDIMTAALTTNRGFSLMR